MPNSLKSFLILMTVSLVNAIPSFADTESVKAKLVKLFPANVEIQSVSVVATLPSVYEVIVNNQFYFVYSKGDHILIGDLISNGQSSREKREQERAHRIISAYPREKMVVFNSDPEKSPVGAITVFTDVDCYYCRQLHQEIGVLNEAGVTVRYLMFPRTGIESESYHKAVSVWCAEDQKSMMTLAKRGEEVPPATCENPVAEQYFLGQKVPIRGTPSIIFDDGRIVPGYIKAQAIIDYFKS